jgi:hypothetical protein
MLGAAEKLAVVASDLSLSLAFNARTLFGGGANLALGTAMHTGCQCAKPECGKVTGVNGGWAYLSTLYGFHSRKV